MNEQEKKLQTRINALEREIDKLHKSKFSWQVAFWLMSLCFFAWVF